MQAHGVASEQLAEEASTASLQAQAALQGADRLRDETKAWVEKRLTERPTTNAVQSAAAAAAEAALRSALSGEDGWMATQQQQLAIQGKQLHAQQQVRSQTSRISPLP